MSGNANPNTSGKTGAMPDPFAAWKAMFQMGEETWSQMLDQMMGTQAFATAMSQWLDNNLKAQEVARRNVEQSLSAMSMPTRADLTRMAGQIVAIDAKLDDLQSTVESIADDVRALREKGPAAIRGDLEALTARVSELTAAVTKMQPAKPSGSARPKASGTTS